MATWPSTLPQEFMEDGYSESPPDNLIRTQTDTGPGKIRKRSTAASRKIQGQLLFTAAQKTIFESFFETTIGYGSLAFDCPLRTGEEEEMRFTSLPSYSPAGGGDFLVTLNLEILA